LVGDLQAGGLVTKRSCAKDGRGYLACLTPEGLARLEVAWSTHVASVRALVFDHVDPGCTRAAARALLEIAEGLDQNPI
jgi:DNA-binding MarR family transcriptional regulator